MSKLFLALAVAASLLIAAPLTVAQVRAEDGSDAITLDANVTKLTTTKIKDVSATLHVVDVDWAELEKCGSDFKRSYYFKRMDVAYKYPNKVRMETKALGVTALVVFDGDIRYYKVPFRSETSSVAGHPGEKQGLLQFGVFAPDYLLLDYDPHFLRMENGLAVYKLTQRRTANKSNEIIWVNPNTHLITRRQSWSGDGRLTMELRYKDVQEVAPGIQLPLRIEIYNPQEKLAAVQAVEDLKVNTGLADSLFPTS